MAVARALDSVLEPAVGNDDPDELLTTRRKGRSLERPLFGAALFGAAFCLASGDRAG